MTGTIPSAMPSSSARTGARSSCTRRGKSLPVEALVGVCGQERQPEPSIPGMISRTKLTAEWPGELAKPAAGPLIPFFARVTGANEVDGGADAPRAGRGS